MTINGGLYRKLSGLLSASGYGFIFNHEKDDCSRALLINAISSAVKMPQMSGLRAMAWQLSAEIANTGPLITPCNDVVCPQCESVCCLNKFGRYDIGDIIYMTALGYQPDEILHNNEPECLPCKYLSYSGCSVSRQLRPFRCNWFFCTPMIEYMESGSKKAYRGFNMLFQDIIQLRTAMLDEFHAAIVLLSESELNKP
ncbi:MAG: hypothetical protein H7843_09870 [Nitrospirota bacterium]